MDENQIERYKNFTDQEYCSPRKLGLRLNSNFTDTVFTYVKAYRDRHAISLPLRRLNPSYLTFYTGTTALVDRFEAFSELLDEFDSRIGFLDGDFEAKEYATSLCSRKILEMADTIEKTECGERSLNAILGGYFSEHESKKRYIARYYDFLDKLPALFDKYGSDVEGFAKEALRFVFGYDDGRYIRTGNPRLSFVADAAPDFLDSSLLSRYMKELIGVIGTRKVPTWMKMLLAGYYVTYIKPFDLTKDNDHNLLMAAILARYALIYDGLDISASYLPLEKMLIFDDFFARYDDKEIRKTGDMTYFFVYAIDALTPMINELLDEFQKEHASAIAKEAVMIPQEEIDAIHPGEKEEPEEPLPAPAVETSPAPAPAPKPIPKIAPKPAEEVMDASEYEVPPVTGELALNVSKKGSQEKDAKAKERAKYILETHPILRKSQANFYSTHCTMGRYYTIQDFKKATRCAYETARTSMELLASEGLYKKLKIKNKFVYTPILIKQGE